MEGVGTKEESGPECRRTTKAEADDRTLVEAAG